MTPFVVAALVADPVVIVSPAAPSADDARLIDDIARELQLGGFEITRLTAEIADADSLRATLITVATHEHAVGGIGLLPTASQITVEAWGEAGANRKSRRRDFVAVGFDERRVVALRAVELLRAVLLEVSLAPAATDQAPAQMPPLIAEAPESAAPKAAVIATEPSRTDYTRTNAWRAGIGVGAERFGDSPDQPAVSVSAGRLLSYRWLAEATKSPGVFAMRENRQDAKHEARDYSALLGVGPLRRKDTWEIGALASGGVSTFAVHGNASAPLITNATTLVRATATGSLQVQPTGSASTVGAD